jgi:hypothetical protein
MDRSLWSGVHLADGVSPVRCLSFKMAVMLEILVRVSLYFLAVKWVWNGIRQQETASPTLQNGRLHPPAGNGKIFLPQYP